MLTGNALDLFWHSCRKKSHLPLRGSLFQNPFNIVNEPHTKHFVCFVQDQRLQIVQLQCPFAHVVHDPARRTDNCVNASSKHTQLSGIVLSTVNRKDVESFDMGGVTLKSLSHLNRQFTRGRKHHDLNVCFFYVHSREKRKCKRGRFSRSGWSSA